MRNDFLFPLLLLLCVSVLACVPFVIADREVVVEYFYLPDCPRCREVGHLIRGLEELYGERILVERIDVGSYSGFSRFSNYDLLDVPAIVINHEYKLRYEEISRERVENVVSGYLLKEIVDINVDGMDLTSPLAFSLGLFSGFSPCLMAMLTFILTYSVGSSVGLKAGVVRAVVFGLGLVAAYLAVGLCVLALKESLASVLVYSTLATWVASGLILITGLSLLGVLKVPLNTKTFLQTLARRYGLSLIGLLFLGVLFSFIKIPCAAPLLFIILSKILVSGSLGDIMLLLYFGAGLLIPFVAVGLVGGGTPYLARTLREKYRKAMKTVSGVILVLFAVWLLLT